MQHPVNPFLEARDTRQRAIEPPPATVERFVVGNSTLYRANCFDVLPKLERVDAVVIDPPYCIGLRYRTFDDALERYDELMQRLIPELIRVTDDGPCFVWQSPLTAGAWNRHFPSHFQLIACCKQYPRRRFRAGHLG